MIRYLCPLRPALIVALAAAWMAPTGLASALADEPFTSAAMQSFIATRSGQVTAAVEDLNTGRIEAYHAGVAEETASIVKVDILETLLHEDQVRHSGLNADDNGLAHGMIEDSDNDDATSLWDIEGGPGAVGAYDADIGMRQTAPNAAWGLTTTTAVDQLTLLRQLVTVGGPLDASSRKYELGLMESVASDQHWGVSGGVPAGVSIAVKNGWLPRTGGWQVNSIGRIDGDGRRYLLAVLTRLNPSEEYGIHTIEGVSGIVWRALGESGVERLGRGHAIGSPTHADR